MSVPPTQSTQHAITIASNVLSTLGFITSDGVTPISVGDKIYTKTRRELATIMQIGDAPVPFAIYTNDCYSLTYIIAKDFGDGVFKPYITIVKPCTCDSCSRLPCIEVYIYDGIAAFSVIISLDYDYDYDIITNVSAYDDETFNALRYQFNIDDNFIQVVPSPQTHAIKPVNWPEPELSDDES